VLPATRTGLPIQAETCLLRPRLPTLLQSRRPDCRSTWTTANRSADRLLRGSEDPIRWRFGSQRRVWAGSAGHPAKGISMARILRRGGVGAWARCSSQCSPGLTAECVGLGREPTFTKQCSLQTRCRACILPEFTELPDRQICTSVEEQWGVKSSCRLTDDAFECRTNHAQDAHNQHASIDARDDWGRAGYGRG
jgi:hypothetical protein